MSDTRTDIRKFQNVTVEIDDLAFGGAGVGRLDGFVVFVRGGLPGDRVVARVERKQKNHAEASLVSIERPSPDRLPAPCPLFGTCGGCSWQNLPYEKQLFWKRKQVADSLERIGGLPGAGEGRRGGGAEPPRDAPSPDAPRVEVAPLIPSPDQWNYRNKMEFTFGTGEGPDGEPGDGVILGFHLPGRFHRIFSVPACLIHPKPFDALLRELPLWAREAGLTAYSGRRHEGFLRHAVIRHSRTTGGVMLALVTHEGRLPDPERLARRLKAACPELQGMVHGINRGVADVATMEEVRWTWGDPVLRETINGLTFRVSPQSFFQTNTPGAERLYSLVVEMAKLGPDDRVLDAYCGAGTIALHCARHARKVAGVELIREAIWDARENARINGVTNATFIAAPAAEGIELARSAVGGDFSRVIIDPPRGGMDKRSLARLIGLGAEIFVYVSCNPATLARDIQTIREGGYELDEVRPVDMFPHTFHIESVVRLRRRG